MSAQTIETNAGSRFVGAEPADDRLSMAQKEFSCSRRILSTKHSETARNPGHD